MPSSAARVLTLALLLVGAGCDGEMVMPDAAVAIDTGGVDGGGLDGGARDGGGVDAAMRSDAPVSMMDAPGFDAPGLDAAGDDAPTLEDAPSTLDAPAVDDDATTPPGDAFVADDAAASPDAFAAADAFTAPPDAFVPPPDAFTAPPDAFTAPPDAFTAPPDAFVPPPDAFTPPPDAFTPPPDAFVPPPDAFVPPPDAYAPDAYMPPPPLGSMPLQNPTASFSQSGYLVGELLDTLIPAPTNSNGWAIATGSGVTTDESAVFETITDSPASANGSVVTLTIHQTSQTLHTLGAFRVSVTTASRSTFADGLATGGNLGSSGIWTTMIPIRATATGGATLNVRADRTILAGGTNPSSSVYTVVLATPLSGITGLRIDALSDASLPDNGPGRSGGGNFVITELVADVAVLPAPSSVALMTATATASQASYSVAEAINGVTTGGNEGWAIDTGTVVAQTACFETTSTTASGNGSFVRATLRFTTLDSYYIGRFRFAATTVDRSMFADGAINGGAIGAGAIWTVLTMLRASATGLTFTLQSDGSVLVAGVVTQPTYTVDFVTPSTALTGVRLEAMEDPSLPSSGPGFAANGNFVLTEMTVAASAF